MIREQETVSNAEGVKAALLEGSTMFFEKMVTILYVGVLRVHVTYKWDKCDKPYTVRRNCLLMLFVSYIFFIVSVLRII